MKYVGEEYCGVCCDDDGCAPPPPRDEVVEKEDGVDSGI